MPFESLTASLCLLVTLGGCHSSAVESTSTSAPAPRIKPTTAADGAHLGVLPPGVGITAGQQAPDAALQDAEGQRVQLRSLIATRRTFVVFYRGGWCPYCNFQIRELAQAYSRFQERGVEIVAISVDRMQESMKTKAAYEILFPLLSDQDLTAHKAFRVVHRADDNEVARLKGYGLDIEEAAGRTHHSFAIPSLFAIDETGTVRWGHANEKYQVRPSVAQMLEVLEKLGWGVNPVKHGD